MDKPLSQSRVLVIDDEPHLMSFLLERMKEKCRSVDISTSEWDAAAALAGQKYDAVLLDIMLPPGRPCEGNEDDSPLLAGARLLTKIRTGAMNGTPKDVPVVVITAFSDPMMMRSISERGVTALLEKDRKSVV